MKAVLLVICSVVFCVSGCAMFTAWKSIPPPGGCDQCHSAAISSNWRITYQVVTVADERGRQAFQTPEYNMPAGNKPDSSLELKKVEELKCFECHKSPSPAHLERKGRFHH